MWKIKNKRILLINFEMSLTGSPRALLNLAIGLKTLGYNVDVWSMNPGPFETEFEKEDIKVRIINFTEENKKNLGVKIRKYKFVIANTVFCAAFASFAKEYTKTILYIMEAANLTQLVQDCYLNPNDIIEADYVLCVSEYSKQRIMNAYPIKRIDILQNYIEPWYKEEKFQKSDNIIRFLVSGTIEYRKGQDVAEEAFLMLPDELQNHSELHFIGLTPEWALNYQKELYKKQNERIKFHNVISDKNELFDFYNSMDVIIIASRDESCSLIALEGAMLKKALLVTENTGAKYVVHNPECILPTSDVLALANAMKRYINDPKKIISEGNANYCLYKERASKEEFVCKLKRILRLANYYCLGDMQRWILRKVKNLM